MQYAKSPVNAGVFTHISISFRGGPYSIQFLRRNIRQFHDDGRSRLSAFWVPTGGITHSSDREDAHSKLIRGGFMRQAHAGLFQFLPFGLRVQEKIERLLDKHMTKIGASKISLSTFSSEGLWQKSGRLRSSKGELFRLTDRKLAKYLLAPTHEEEITLLAGSIIKSYKELPVRLYQITRKYRDELRPRQGLLRAREFIMKDLYTFDSSEESALQTYETVRKAYAAFFDEFKIPYLTAEASSGNMGGDFSHEYHLPSSKGEDNIITCTSCPYVANEEIAGIDPPRVKATLPGLSSDKENSLYVNEKSLGTAHRSFLEWEGKYSVWRGISEDRLVLYEAIYPNEVEFKDGPEPSLRTTEINPHAVKRHAGDIDFSIKVPSPLDFSRIVPQPTLGSKKENKNLPRTPRSYRNTIIRRLYDYRLPQAFIENYEANNPVPSSSPPTRSSSKDRRFPPVDLVKPRDGDRCLKCTTGTLKVQNAIELGHTFHLGTRYSAPLQASFIPDPSQKSRTDLKSSASSTSFLNMGCHGIGVSRMIAAIAESLCDEKGLNWPRAMAPFEVVIVPTKGLDADAAAIYDLLVQKGSNEDTNPPIDAILDDRNKQLGWKLIDADLIGYPVIVVLGKKWHTERACEVQCRRLDGWKEFVPEEKLREVVQGLLERL